MSTSISDEKDKMEATAAAQELEPAQKSRKKARVAPPKPHVAPSKGKPAHPGQPCQESAQGRQKGRFGPPGQQDRPGHCPPGEAQRRHSCRTDQSHRLAAAFGPWLHLRHAGQEDGPEDRIRQTRRRRAGILDPPLAFPVPPFCPPGFGRGGLFCPISPSMIRSSAHQSASAKHSLQVRMPAADLGFDSGDLAPALGDSRRLF